MTDEKKWAHVPLERWHRSELKGLIAPALARRGIDLATLDDFVHRALTYKGCILGGSHDGLDVHLDVDSFLADMRDDPAKNGHLFPQPSGTRSPPPLTVPAHWPAGAPVPGSEEFRKSPPEARLRWNNLATSAAVEAARKAKKTA
jgi:hypothetical protein